MGWRSKFIFLLIVYFAGFATAIYCLAPVPDNHERPFRSHVAVGGHAASDGDRGFVYSVLKSDEFAKSFNAGLHRFLGFAKDSANHAAVFLKEKLDERAPPGNG